MGSWEVKRIPIKVPFRGFRGKVKQAKKGRRWMPRLSEAKKDVISCEKPGLGANNHTTPGSPNGATQY